MLNMSSEGNINYCLESLDGKGLQNLIVNLHQHLITRIDQWFEEHEAGDE